MFCRYRQREFKIFKTFAFFCILILTSKVVNAASIPENPEEISWHISALAVTFDSKKELYIAEDDVVITGGKTRLEADYVEFSNKTKDAFARGNVLLISGEDSISCNAMNINLTTETGTVNKGTIFVQKNNFYIDGENIRKTGKFSYSADKGSITSCSGDSPDWKITGKDIKVTIEGYGSAKHTVFWARNFPAVYSPYLAFPVRVKRKTGLLFPRVTTSDRKGFEYEQPLFLALSRNTDASIYVDYMSDRGTKIGTEFRYILDNKSKGTLFFDYLDDKQIDDGTSNTKDYSFESTPQRTNKDRYWFRMKHNQDLSKGFTAKLDIDLVSDEDYLLEFKDGFTGYDDTKAYFEETFGRSLDEYDDYTRKNWININKSWSNYTFNIDAFFYDNIRARQQDTPNLTLQTLPSIQLEGSKQQIGPSNFFYSLNTEYRSFYREDTTDNLVSGHRADIYPKFYLPLKLGRFLNFEPSAGIRETIWYTDDFTDINGNSDSLRNRLTYDIGAELSTKFNRVFNPGNQFADKIKHEIVPKLEYVYTPDIDQDDLPFFDALDRIGEKNLLIWSLANTFISKKTHLSPKGDETPSYREFAFFRLFQGYDIKKENDDEKRPFSDIGLDLELYPHRYFTLDMDLTWSPYDNDFNTFNIANIIRDNRGDSLTTGYRFTKNDSESLYSKVDITLTRELTAYCSIEQNLKEDITVETTAGFSIKKSCWMFNLYYSKTQDDDHSISFLVNLYGIGDAGTR